MTNPSRFGAFVVFVLAMAATLFCALGLPHVAPHLSESVKVALVLGCIIVQCLAFFWYCLSYIPYGRRMCKACCVSALAEEG